MANEILTEENEILNEFTKQWLAVQNINLPAYFSYHLIQNNIITIPISSKKTTRVIFFENLGLFAKSYLVLERISNAGNRAYLLINMDGESFVLYKTKHSFKTFLVPYPIGLNLSELTNVETVQISTTKPIEAIVKYIFGTPEPESVFTQGNLSCIKLKQNRFTEFAFSLAAKSDENSFYDHEIKTTNTFWLSRTYYNKFKLLQAYEQINITHPEHPIIILNRGYYILYHPEPEAD